MKETTFLLLWLVCLTGAGLLDGQTVINGSRSILGAWDASAAASTKPVKSGPSLPATCSQGEFFFHTAGAANRRLYACATANTWEQTAYQHGTAAQIPAGCGAGQIFFATDASAGTNLYFCTTAGNPGTWTRMSGGVASVFGRNGDVAAANGDYSFSQISGTLPVSAIADTTGTGAVVLADAPTLTTPSFSGAIGSNFNIGTKAVLYEIANESTTGTNMNLLAKLTGAPAAAVTIATSDTSGIAGVCLANCGMSGNAQLAQSGQAACQFDGGTTAGNYVQPSSLAAGNCHDLGPASPSSGQVIGRVLTTNASAGIYPIRMFSSGIEGGAGGGGGAGGASTLASYTTVNSETSGLQNSRQWRDGTSTKFNTSTVGKIAVDQNIFDRSVYTVIEEWTSGVTTSGGLGSMNWKFSNNIASPTVTYSPSENQHPGILKCASSAVNADACDVYQGAGLYGISQIAGWKFQALVRIGSTTQGRYYFGLIGGGDYIWAMYDSTASTKWRLLTRDGGAGQSSTTDSTITATTGWHLLQLEMTTPGTVRFSVDGETAIASSSNLPQATTILSIYHRVLNNTAASNYMEIDWTAFQMTGLTR